ncbi:trypsin-like peptidase domain-containing protein [Candidatus Margulisiibacteriota bacterium]
MVHTKSTKLSVLLRRAVAALIEIVGLSSVLIFLLLTIPIISPDSAMAFWQGFYFLFVLALWLLITGYMLFKDSLYNGQSIMKKLLGLRVINYHSQIKCRWWQSLMRNILLFIPFFVLIEVVVAFFNSEGRRLGDYLARTVVVDAEEQFLPKPKHHKKIHEYSIKSATWMFIGMILMALFFYSYNFMSVRNTSRKLRSSADSVVTIYTYDTDNNIIGYASGFFINSRGVIITSRHALKGAARAVAIYRQKENLEVDSVIADDEEKDIVILQIRAVDTPHLKLGNSDRVAVGDDVYTIGAPRGLLNTISKGIISQIRHTKGVKMIQIDAPISSGNSGGPLLDKNLDVIGVNAGYMSEGQNLNFAVPVNYVKALLRKENIGYR